MGHLQENIVKVQLQFFLDEIIEYYGLKLVKEKQHGYILRKKSKQQQDFSIYINDILKEMER